MSVAIIDNGAFQQHLKHVDSSIVLFSSSNDMTRYDIADLIKIKDSKLSQQPPSCFYDPNIMRLNILKYKNRDPVVVDIQMKAFREKLQNISVTGWDPHIFQLLRNYHNALLNPFYNGYTGNYQNQQQQIFNQQQPQAFNQQPQQQQFQPSPEQVSLMEKQQAVLDKIPSYDRKMNFFDNITTTANIPPPRTMMNFDHRHHGTFFKRPNNNNNHQQQQQPHHSNFLRKPNSCASEQHGSSYSSSVGYFSGNDTKSSFGEESLLEKPFEKRSCFENNKKVEPTKEVEEEKEPEWFSVPATLEDFIDLHGFSDEDAQEQSPTKKVDRSAEVKQTVDNQRNNMNMSNNSFNNDFQSNLNRRYNHNNSYNRYSHNNSGYSSHNSSYNQSFSSQNSSYSNPNNSYYNPRNMNYRNNAPVNNNANQRFRNPLHYSKPPRTTAPQIINPFFDAWKSGKFLNQQNVSFTDLMEPTNFPKTLPSSAMHISEVENRMKQQQIYNPMNHQAPPPTAVPQFFQNLANNWGVRVNENPANAYQYQNNVGPPTPPQQAIHDGYKMPTQEQLQQFTSDIMRNAIMRKNQQYHDENNYQK